MDFVDYSLSDGGVLSIARSPQGYHVLVDGAAVAPPIEERLLRSRVSIDLAGHRGRVGIRVDQHGAVEVIHDGQACRRSDERPTAPAGIGRSRRLLVFLGSVWSLGILLSMVAPREGQPFSVGEAVVAAVLHFGAALWAYRRPADAWMAFAFVIVAMLAGLALVLREGYHTSMPLSIVYLVILGRGTINSWRAHTAHRAPQSYARAV